MKPVSDATSSQLQVDEDRQMQLSDVEPESEMQLSDAEQGSEMDMFD